MQRTTTLKDAFGHFGTVPRNSRWAWSAVSPDGKTVALTVWDHEWRDGGLDYHDPAKRERWMHKLGNKDRIRNLQHAIVHCNGEVRVVRVTAIDPKAEHRQIKARRADPDTVLKISDLDPVTGEFRASPVRR